MRTLLSFIFLFCSFIEINGAEKPIAIVSVAPHKFFVEKIAGDTVKVIVIVPATSTPHSYEPSPRQIMEAAKADVWFRIGEGFEKKAIQALQAYRPQMKIVDLRYKLPLIPAPHHCHSGNCCSADGADLHIWLSLKMAQIEAETIAASLQTLYPQNKDFYQENLVKFLGELQTRDNRFKELFANDKGRVVMVSHPAYAYFCRDYDLQQLSIEVEGKEPTPQTMNKILERARGLKINTVFTQAQYGIKGATLIAELLSAKVVDLNPYAEDYLKSMDDIADAFSTSFRLKP